MILLPKNCGFCNGANKALSLVYSIYEREIKKENPKQIYIYKEILHNETVNEELKDLGIKIIYDLKEVSSDDIVILKTHGEEKNTYDYLNKYNIEYYDATCPFIVKIHEKIEEKYNEGYEIIIIGKINHPEVIASNSWCNNEAVIISSEEDLINIDKEKKNKFVICQTTIAKNIYEKLKNNIKEKFIGYNIEYYDAICSLTNDIILSSVEVAKKCDFMFVIGGTNSSNVNNLFNEVSKITNTYKFSKIEEFSKFVLEEDINNNLTVGLTGGSSTPYKEILNYKSLLAFLIYYKGILNELKLNQDTINNALINPNDAKVVKKIINYFSDLNRDGKYIRAVLISLGYYLASYNTDNFYLPLSYAYEIFQTSILIHDDIIDNAKIRRDKPTIPRRICKEYLNLKNDKNYTSDVLKQANSLAICAGDFGFYEANKLIVNSYEKNKNLGKLLNIYNDIVIKTIKGEIMDVAYPFLSKYHLDETKEEDILKIYELKTSWYTIIGPFKLGFSLGGKDLTKTLESILNKIGISFQIKDDILGIFKDTKKIGKSNTSDISEFKQTILYTYIMNSSYKKEFLKIYGKNNINRKELETIRNLFIKSGALEYANNYLNDLYNDAYDEIDKSNLNMEAKDLLKGLLIYLNIRDY